MTEPNGKEPILIQLLSTENIEQIRKCFHHFQTLNKSRFVHLINQFIPQDKRLCAKKTDRIFQVMDTEKEKVVNVRQFLDYLMYECELSRGIEQDACGFLSPSYFSGLFPSEEKNLGVDHIQLMPNKLKDMGCIRKIYPYNLSRLDPHMPESQKRGLYVTVIGKRGIGFWRPELTMITDDALYASKEVPDYRILPTLDGKHLNPDTMAGRNALRAIKKYDKVLPEFDIICMDDFELIACYQILDRTLLFYDAKMMELKCSITHLPLDITCSDYIPIMGGVSRILLGGSNGEFYIIELTSSVKLFQTPLVKRQKFQDIVSQTDPSQLRVHHVRCHKNGYLTKIQYGKHQNYILSSSMFDDKHPTSCNTLAVLKFTVKGEHPKFIKNISPPKYFPVLNSISTFCCSAVDGFVLSGGWDTIVRVWHLSDLNSKEGTLRCHTELRGHKAFISGLHFHDVYRQVISMSVLGIIIIYNYAEGSIIQSFNCTHLMPCSYKFMRSLLNHPEIPPAFYFCKRTESILIGEESMIVIPFGDFTKEAHLTSNV